MRHGIAHRKLGRNPGHRKALLRNMMNALVRSERIETTVEKAKEVRRLAERLITLGKADTTHARRRAFSLLSDKANTEKVFSTLAKRFVDRQGGYTRIVRTGYRVGDGADLAILEYLPAEEKKAKAKKGKKKKRAPEKPAEDKTKPAGAKPAARRARKEGAGEKRARKGKGKEKPGEPAE